MTMAIFLMDEENVSYVKSKFEMNIILLAILKHIQLNNHLNHISFGTTMNSKVEYKLFPLNCIH